MTFLIMTMIGCKYSKKTEKHPEVNIGYVADSCSSEGIIVKRNGIYNNHFTRYNNGWTGGDATYSIALDDDTNLWIFGDTFLGTVNEDRSRVTPSPLINNTLVVEKNGGFTTLHGGTTDAPEAYLKPPEEGWWYWPAHGQIHEGTLQLIMFAIKPSGEKGMWGFEYAAIDIVNLSLPDLKVISTKRQMPFKGVNYGANIFQYDGHTYIYGARKDEEDKHLRIARISGTDLQQPWKFLGVNNSWVSSAEDAIDTFASVSEQFTVIQRKTGFYLMTQNHRLQPMIYIYKSTSPIGPFGDQKTLYCTPERKDKIFTYNAFVHEQFSTEDDLFISYNNNSFSVGDLNTNADNYRPHFINVRGWK